MTRTLQILVVLLLVSTTNLIAQVEGDILKNASFISEIFVDYGTMSGNSSIENLSSYRRMAPTSELLKEDFSSYDSHPSGSSYFGDHFGIMIGFVPNKNKRAEQKKSPFIRIGLNYESGTYFFNYFSKSTSFRYDTLYNSQGQSIYYRDSVNQYRTNMYYSSSSLSAEASILLRTNAARRWMFYVGAGLSSGVSFRNEVNVKKWSSDFIEEYEVLGTPHPTHPYHNSHASQNEVINLRSSWVISGFVPLGIDFRLGKKNEFLKQVHLFIELRPGIKMMGIPVIGTNTSTFTLSSFGLRYVWN